MIRKLCTFAVSSVILALCVHIGAQTGPESVRLRIRLIDADTGQSVAGIMRVFGADGKPVELPGLFDRMAGLTNDLPGVHWYVVPSGGAETTLPADRVQIHALSGLETALARQDLDLSKRAPAEATVALNFLFRPSKLGLAAGNTHLHLRGLTPEKADDYLRHIPAADGLRILFISYLERDKEDRAYVTNRHAIGPQPKLSAAGVLVHNGEEHRHNFTPYGEGYGHVMFLNIKELVKPVSLGPGITGGGFDDTPLRDGIDNARRQGGTVIWCHGNLGHEDVVNAVAGKLHALNVFDGSRGDKYEVNYYRYLNIGLRMPISTGTDWFLYDMSRVYAEVGGELTVASWLEALKAGRCQATNGPLLTLKVDGKAPGDAIDLQEPRKLRIESAAVGRAPLQKLELIHNGKVIKTQQAGRKEPGRLEFALEVPVDGPGWFALRCDGDVKNEFGRPTFAHTSPIYVTYRRQGIFEVDDALALLKQLAEGRAAIQAKGRFSSDEAQGKLLALYDDAAESLRSRIAARK